MDFGLWTIDLEDVKPLTSYTCNLTDEQSAALDIDDPDVLVVANRDPLAHNPHDRITLTFPAINRARLVVFTVSGATKRDAFARVAAGDDLPAARVRAYEAVDRIHWPEGFCRRDIGWQAVKREKG